MDSMRNLRTVLPSATTRRQASQPPERLLQAFKQAALSVTTLYKAAASEQEQAYKEGYRDALEELLRFLDGQNLGVQDGEAWRIRKWATERVQGTDGQAHATSDSEEDGDEEKRARSCSPVMRKDYSEEVVQPAPHTPVRTSSETEVPFRPESAPPTTTITAPPATQDTAQKHSSTAYAIPSADFSFRSTHQLPPSHDVDMESPDSQLGSQTQNHTLQVNFIPRASRSSPRRGNTAPRSSNKTRANGTGLGPGAGQKRSAIEMFWDISGINDKDNSPFRGGKRGRFT